MKNSLKLSISLTLFLSSITVAHADSFTVLSGDSEESSQSLSVNEETGTINKGGQLNTSNNAITINNGISNTIITNNGSISVSSGSRNAIVDSNTSSGTTIINNGAITMQGSSSNGIVSNGLNLSLTNSGSITLQGSSSNGIYSANNNATIINNGTITSQSSSSGAILSNGHNTTITNSGTLLSQGSSSSTINSTGSGNVINNSGKIIAQGSSSTALNISDANTTINNSGVIQAQGTSSTALNIGNADTTLTNTGKILSTGSAINSGGGNNTVFLGKGSQIIGTVNLGTGTDSITATGNGISTRVLTSNVNNISIASGVAGVVSGGNTIHTIDPTSVSALTIGASNLTKSINGAVNSQISQSQDSGNKKDKIWGKFLNSSFEKDENKQNLSYDHDYNGIIIGYELDSHSGLIFGVSKGEIRTNSQSFESDVNSVFAGIYKGFKLEESTYLNTNIIAGYEQYKNKRSVVDNINGYQTARSDVDNIFISPSLEIEYRIKLHETFELRPNASVNYTYSSFESNTESGTSASNITMNSRSARILNSKIGVLGNLTLLKNYKIHLGLGLDSRNISEDKANASISGSSLNFATNNDQSTNGHYINLGFNLLNFSNLTLGFEVEKRTAGGGESQESVALHASYKF